MVIWFGGLTFVKVNISSIKCKYAITNTQNCTYHVIVMLNAAFSLTDIRKINIQLKYSKMLFFYKSHSLVMYCKWI